MNSQRTNQIRKDQRDELITNLRRIPDKITEGTIITDFEIEIIHWEAHLEEHRNRIEKETEERIEKIQKKR